MAITINGKTYRNQQEQIYKNAEDIEELKNKIKEWYSCDTELNSSSVSAARTNTNVPDGINDGFLLDPVGNFFKITGGDEDNLLISFYTSIKGPQGDQGTPGASSNDKGTYLTHVQPTLSDSVYTLSTGNIDNISSDSIPVQVNDIIVYIDSNDQPTSVYLVASISGTTLTLTKEGDYAKGKQLYRHTITIEETDGATYKIKVSFAIDDERSTSFDISSLKEWLHLKGYENTADNYKTNRKWCVVSGRSNLNGNVVQVIGVWFLDGAPTKLDFTVLKDDITYDRYQLGSSFTFDDYFKEL